MSKSIKYEFNVTELYKGEMMKIVFAILLFYSMTAYALDAYQGVKFTTKKEQFKAWGIDFSKATYSDLGKEGASYHFTEENGLTVLGQKRDTIVITDNSGRLRTLLINFTGDNTIKSFEHLNDEIKKKYKPFRLAAAEEIKLFNNGTSDGLFNVYENGQVGVTIQKVEKQLVMTILYQCLEGAAVTRKKFEKPASNGL